MPEGGGGAERSIGAPGWRRWLALVFTLATVTMTVIDNTVLVVSVARIMEDLDTDVVSVQWIFTGYALVFASLLVIAGRLGDMFGPRRIVLIGTALFGIGSLVAAVSQSLPMLLVGQSLIEGTGAALLVPNTLSLIARTFSGREQIAAFSAYATSLGVAASMGPVLGGYLTTSFSWRWAFGINVVLAPIVLVGLFVTTDRDRELGGRQRLDVRGAVLIASGMLLLVFGLSQGEVYGWWTPTAPFTIGSLEVWGTGAAISIVPIALAVGIGLLVAFCLTEMTLERRAADPLFEFSQFRHRTFRLANLTSFFGAFAQLGIAVSLALYLQESRDLSPLQNGLWVAPSGAAMLFGAPCGGWTARRWGARFTLRVGAMGVLVGLAVLIVVMPMDVSYLYVLPGFLVFGFSVGMTQSQIARVLLHDIPLAHTGAASGINMTARQAATALGVATMGSIFAAVAAEHGVELALRPALAVAALTFGVAAVLAWRIPRIDGERASSTEVPPPGSPRQSAPETAPLTVADPL